MVERNHASPNGNTRFKILVELSHFDLGIFRRDYAGVTIFREVAQAVPFNIFDLGTWFGATKFVRAGNPGTIAVSGAFEDAQGNDIQGILNVSEINGPGHFERFALFVFFNGRPSDFGNDARSVRLVRFSYQLPWEQETRELIQS